jgi:hypothetical protein
MAHLNSIFDIDVCDPFTEIAEFIQFEQEKNACKTKEEQINFMYKYYSQNSITINELAKDYDILYNYLLRFNQTN